MSSQKNAKLQQNTQLLNLSLTNLETILPIWFNYQKINNENIPSSGLCPCIWLCLCLGTWELLLSSGKSGAMALSWTRQRDARDKYALTNTRSLSCSSPSKVVCQRDELSFSFHFVSITDYYFLSRTEGQSWRTRLRCPALTILIKTIRTSRLLMALFSSYLHCLSAASGVLLHACSCLARSPFSAGLFSVSLPRILPTAALSSRSDVHFRGFPE